jgi:DNA-directed RNA polymerase subunit RPC12/RpoP
MALKIRCTGCEKKISIDEAFAGGVCRCPYCSQLVVVPAPGRGDWVERPDEPGGRPEAPLTSPSAGRGGPAGWRPGVPAGARPDSPVSPVPARHVVERAAGAAPAHPEQVPLAQPVRLQGVLNIILIIGFLAMLAVLAVVLYMAWVKASQPASAPGPTSGPASAANPLIAVKADRPTVADIPIAAPVMYCLDGGSSMREAFNYTGKMVRLSLRTLKGGRFNVVLLTEAGNKLAGEGYLDGAAGDEKVKEFFAGPYPGGATNIEKGLEQALDSRPATVVLFAAKSLDPAGVDRLAAKAKGQRTVISCVILSGNEAVVESLSRLARQTGGRSRAFTLGQLEDWNAQSKDLD